MPGVVAWLEPGLAAPPPFARRLGPRELMQMRCRVAAYCTFLPFMAELTPGSNLVG
jgi:hypothetical protein